MLESIFRKGTPCPDGGSRRVPPDIEKAIAKWRRTTPHMYEMEAIARRGC